MYVYTWSSLAAPCRTQVFSNLDEDTCRASYSHKVSRFSVLPQQNFSRLGFFMEVRRVRVRYTWQVCVRRVRVGVLRELEGSLRRETLDEGLQFLCFNFVL